MNTIICGDLHGKLSVAKDILSDPLQPVAFVGDLLDSFSMPVKQQAELLDLILDACAQRDNVTCLMGNHELSYLDPEMRCSGFTVATAAHVMSRMDEMRRLFGRFAKVHDFIVTHAGITSNWLPPYVRYEDEAAIINYLETCPEEDFNAIGYARGGNDPVGGPRWCDYWKEFAPLPSIKQIFGHSAYRPRGQRMGVVTKDDRNYNIDCLDWSDEVLEVSEDGAKILVL